MEQTEKLHIYVLAPAKDSCQAMVKALGERQWLEVHFFSEVEPAVSALSTQQPVDGLILVAPHTEHPLWHGALLGVLYQWRDTGADVPVMVVVNLRDSTEQRILLELKDLFPQTFHLCFWTGAATLLVQAIGFVNLVRGRARRS